jgi:deoxyadenosine/deoxycytidine kinase
MGRHIAVCGIIGAGKSTLVRGLADNLAYLALEERFEENPYLSHFYEDPPAWAFRNYVFFFQRTVDDYRRARTAEAGGVQERTLEEHFEVFGQEFHSRGYLDRPDFEMLSELTATTARLLEPPDLLIHVEIDPREAMSRIQGRASDAEGEIDLDYLEALNGRYAGFLSKWDGPLLKLDGNALDFRQTSTLRSVVATIRGIGGLDL